MLLAQSCQVDDDSSLLKKLIGALMDLNLQVEEQHRVNAFNEAAKKHLHNLMAIFVELQFCTEAHIRALLSAPAAGGARGATLQQQLTPFTALFYHLHKVPVCDHYYY